MPRITTIVAAAIVATACLAIPAPASALPYEPPPTTRSDAAQSDADNGTGINAATAYPYANGGDNPVDHPGMSRAQHSDSPSTIEIVRPERTIVRDADEALPVILSGAALLLVLASLGITLIRTRVATRPGGG